MNETEEDFEFIFSTIRQVARDVMHIEYEPTNLVADASPAITN